MVYARMKNITLLFFCSSWDTRGINSIFSPRVKWRKTCLIFHQQIEAIFRIFSLAEIFGYLLRKSFEISLQSVALNQRLDSNHGLELLHAINLCKNSSRTFKLCGLNNAKTYDLFSYHLPNSHRHPGKT